MKIKRRKADILYAKYLRKLKGYTCERCGRRYKEGDGLMGLHVSHFYGRAKESVRFNPENTDLLCYGCHQFFTSNPALYAEWKKDRLGEDRYKALMVLANTLQKKDDKLVLLWLEKALGDNSISPMKNKRVKIDRGPECKAHKLKQCSLCHWKPKQKKKKSNVIEY